jgi:hypothetical protein
MTRECPGPTGQRRSPAIESRPRAGTSPIDLLADTLGPSPNAEWGNTPTVLVVAGGPLVDYSAVRSSAGTLAVQLTGTQPLVPPLPANGTMKITFLREYAPE